MSPSPLFFGTSGWYFDVAEGLERMRIRRIGRNELATMQAVPLFFDHPMEYARQDHNGNGILEYAQQLISTPGTQDSLSWDSAPGEALSPLGSLVADRSAGGGYHGYFFRILKARGGKSPGGPKNYMILIIWVSVIPWARHFGGNGIIGLNLKPWESSMSKTRVMIALPLLKKCPFTGSRHRLGTRT
ncbi:MAG: DUF2950 family protein [Candidatus Methanofishera endochildressiae]|uniref:DUF2950 family protein n=1 Tax=Candidatus Methanofishera endochildressiae TaxID=2738884 RepID=A0A7Z0SD56_9GAMM|nr:DUF2950 family protein [Candidatus Methanofishera endochildressiae]